MEHSCKIEAGCAGFKPGDPGSGGLIPGPGYGWKESKSDSYKGIDRSPGL